MSSIARRLAACLLALAASSAVAQQNPSASAPRVFGVWRLECLPPGHAGRPPGFAPAAPFCILGQLVATDEQQRQVVLAATVDFADGPDSPALRFRMASAIRRESGLGLRVDALPEMRLPILACDQRVCVAAGRLTAAVQARIESGRAAEVDFMLADGRMLPVPFALTGFGEGMAALRAAMAQP